MKQTRILESETWNLKPATPLEDLLRQATIQLIFADRELKQEYAADRYKNWFPDNRI